jgi:ATP-dependent Clp protease ATP-binding subunit ClpA
MQLIVDLQMKEIRERLGEHGLKVDLSPAAREWLARIGYDPAFGARPFAFAKFVSRCLSACFSAILNGESSSM